MSLLSPLLSLPIAFVDVETTGASSDSGDRVIELGIARYENGRLASTYQQLINPNHSLSPLITQLTGITAEMLEGQPTFQAIHQDAIACLRGAVIAGHNIPFDLSFLRNEFRKCGVDLPVAFKGHHVVDTVRLARKRFGRKGNGLQALAARLDLRQEKPDPTPLFPSNPPPDGEVDLTPHRALADALITARLFDYLIQPPFLAGWGTTLLDLLQAQGGPIPLAGTPAKNAVPLELEEALDRRLPIQLHYLDATDTPTTRIITPLEVRKFRGEMILLAFCALRQEKRSFKLARIIRLTKPPELDPDTQLSPPVDD